MDRLRVRVPDPDLGAAARVRVRVAAVLHHGDGQRDDVVVLARLDPAGAHSGRVVGHVAGVGEHADGGGEKGEEDAGE